MLSSQIFSDKWHLAGTPKPQGFTSKKSPSLITGVISLQNTSEFLLPGLPLAPRGGLSPLQQIAWGPSGLWEADLAPMFQLAPDLATIGP